MTFAAQTVLSGTRIGDSIAVNGVCLTVTRCTAARSCADVMAESLRRSNLGGLKPGAPVNLERALLPDTRLGGHLVSGHIDGTGVVTERRPEGNAVWFRDPLCGRLSGGDGAQRICRHRRHQPDAGVSRRRSVYRVHYSAYHGRNHPGGAALGTVVNLETDIIGKYVRRYSRHKRPAAPRPVSRRTFVGVPDRTFSRDTGDRPICRRIDSTACGGADFFERNRIFQMKPHLLNETASLNGPHILS